MCLRLLRLAEFTREKDSVKKPHERIQTSLADRFSQLHDAENAWKKKVNFICKWML